MVANHKSGTSTVCESVDADESRSLVERIIETSQENGSQPNVRHEPISGMVTARIVAFQGTLPQLLMEISGELRYSTAIAVTGEIDAAKDIGATVCVSFDRSNPHRPIVLGKLQTGLNDRVSKVADRIEITSETEIVLRCGKSSIHLRSDGTVAIRGTNVASRASETNRIRGGNVQIN